VRRDLRCAKAGDGPWRGGASEAERGEGVVSARSKQKERKKERTIRSNRFSLRSRKW